LNTRRIITKLLCLPDEKSNYLLHHVKRSLRLNSPYYDCRAALSIHTFISLFRVDITPKNRKGLQAQKPTAEHLLRTRVLNVLPSTSPTKPTKLKPTCSLTVALTRDDRDKMFSKCGGLVLLEYCSFTTLVPKRNMATQNAKRTVLRSQNRTRDLSVTIYITAERDKPTTPSGVMQLMLRLICFDERFQN
jgi:hypothetical protein